MNMEMVFQIAVTVGVITIIIQPWLQFWELHQMRRSITTLAEELARLRFEFDNDPDDPDEEDVVEQSNVVAISRAA